MDNKLIAPIRFNQWPRQGSIEDEDLPLVAVWRKGAVFRNEPVLAWLVCGLVWQWGGGAM
jgi:hypothetical protein